MTASQPRGTRRADLAAALAGILFALAAAAGVWATSGGGTTCLDPLTGASLPAEECAPPPPVSR